MNRTNTTTMDAFHIRTASPDDALACIDLRGRTRQNAVPAWRLAELGITADSWGEDIRSGKLTGHIACQGEHMVGYGFGDVSNGEVVVLALLPEAEGQGLGQALLSRVVADLHAAGHQRLFLGCSSDPNSRSHGFYRRLGWRPTGRTDRYGDEELELSTSEGT